MSTNDPFDFSRAPLSQPPRGDQSSPGPGYGPPPGRSASSGPDFGFPPADPTTRRSDFGNPDGGAIVADRVVTAPVVWVYAAVTCGLVALVAGALTMDGVILYAAGWALAGPIAIGLLAVFSRIDAGRQTYALYSYPGWLAAVYRAAFGLALVAIIVNALRIAYWYGHR